MKILSTILFWKFNDFFRLDVKKKTEILVNPQNVRHVLIKRCQSTVSSILSTSWFDQKFVSRFVGSFQSLPLIRNGTAATPNQDDQKKHVFSHPVFSGRGLLRIFSQSIQINKKFFSAEKMVCDQKDPLGGIGICFFINTYICMPFRAFTIQREFEPLPSW